MEGQPQTFFVNPGEPIEVILEVSAEPAGKRMAVTVTPKISQKRPERQVPLRHRRLPPKPKPE